MAISPVSAVTQEQFMQLFLAQLQNQNPLDPVSDQDLLGQLTQFSTLQSITQLNASFADVLQLQQLTQGSSLIGRQITFSTAGQDGLSSGIVSAVNVENGAIVLRVGDTNVSLDQVRSVEAAP